MLGVARGGQVCTLQFEIAKSVEIVRILGKTAILP